MAFPRYRVLCLGGGATNLTLMSGALHRLHQAGLHDEGRGPNIITMAGAGVVVGLHYLAPKGIGSTKRFSLDALENTINIGVSDAICEMFPINYKAFTKGGEAADLFNELWCSVPEVQEAMRQHGMNDVEAMASDLLMFMGAVLCPSDVDYSSQGICGHSRYIEELVDFEAVQAIDPNDIEIEINAFCIEDQEIVDFTNYERDQYGNPVLRAGRYIPKEITVDHLRAALSFPFLHPPYKIADKHYFEGAAIQCLNDYKIGEIKDVEWIVVLDPLRKNMIGLPRDLLDAFALSIIMPTVGLAELGRQILQFKTKYAAVGREADDEKVSAAELMVMLTSRGEMGELYFADFKISKDRVNQAWGWSRSSMKELFAVGQKSGTVIGDAMQKNMHLR